MDWYDNGPAPTDPFRSADKASRDKESEKRERHGKANRRCQIVGTTLNFWIFKIETKKGVWRNQNQQANRHLFASKRQLRIGGHYHCLNTKHPMFPVWCLSVGPSQDFHLFNRDLAYWWLRPVPSLSHLPAYRFTGLTPEGHLLSFYLTHIRYCSSVWRQRKKSGWFGKTVSTRPPFDSGVCLR